jgi:pimeloyl-ACP methyl ester carboxylesterase
MRADAIVRASGGMPAAARGVREAGYVPIRGIPQWLSLAGNDRANPVLLVVHGGPGAAFEPLTRDAWRPWLAHFTVAHWDQPGAGRTHRRHGANIGPLTLDRIVQDGLAVATHLRDRFAPAPIVLLGASWGSIVGIEMVKSRPELFTAYVGAGQVVDMVQNEAVGYAGLEARLHARGARRALQRLREIGPPPYADLPTLLAQRRILVAHPPASERGMARRAAWRMLRAGYGIADMRAWMQGPAHSASALFDTVMSYRVPDNRLPLPAAFIQGADDIQTPTALVEAYAARLDAPASCLIELPGGGHNALLFMPDAFLAALREATAPFVARPSQRGR